jgi:DNA-damage-inducible protein D
VREISQKRCRIIAIRDYWGIMKKRVKSEDGIELSTICRQMKLRAPDGKMRETDIADMQGLLSR